MRHRKAGTNFGREQGHRKSMMKNLTVSLIEHELIRTTVPRAKELRRFAEPLITRAKEDSVHNRRIVFDRVRDKAAVGKLFTDLGPHFKERNGGYMRILKCGNRPGDNAPMAYVQLVDRDSSDSADAEAQPPRATNR